MAAPRGGPRPTRDTGSHPRRAAGRLRLGGAAGAAVLLATALLGRRRPPLAWQSKRPPPAPGPLVIRSRTTKLRDPYTNLPREIPKEADAALDYFQRTFPEVVTEEHRLIQRWEDLAAVFGGSEAANELIFEDPSVLRWPRPMPRRAFHYLSMHLGPQVARRVVFACPFLLTKKAGQMRRTLPALLNVFGTKKRLAEIAMKYPMLMHAPTGDFYKGMPNMIAVCGNPEAALETAREAMAEVVKMSRRPTVPEGYPALVAIMGGFKEAQAAINQEPMLLKFQGEQFLGRVARLRQLLGREGAQEAMRKAPYFLLHEQQRKSHKFKQAFDAMERVFGREDAQRRAIETPALLELGVCLERALGFAERKLGSREAVRDNFEKVLRRTGLADHLGWVSKPRPRRGYWTPKLKLPFGYPSNPCSWSPHRNPTGRAGPARGRWDENEEEGSSEDDTVVYEAEVVSSVYSTPKARRSMADFIRDGA